MAAGDILAFATLAKDGEPLERGILWSLTEPTPKFDGSYAQVAKNGAAQWRFTVSEGTYRLIADRDNATATTTIEVAQGRR